jgi:hypothetical protein
VVWGERGGEEEEVGECCGGGERERTERRGVVWCRGNVLFFVEKVALSRTLVSFSLSHSLSLHLLALHSLALVFSLYIYLSLLSLSLSPFLPLVTTYKTCVQEAELKGDCMLNCFR